MVNSAFIYISSNVSYAQKKDKLLKAGKSAENAPLFIDFSFIHSFIYLFIFQILQYFV